MGIAFGTSSARFAAKAICTRRLQGSIAPVEHAPPTFFRIQENWHTARESNPLSAGVGARPRSPLADGMQGFRFWNGMMNSRRRPSSVATSKGALEWRDSCQPLWRRRRLVLVWFHFESLSASGGASPALGTSSQWAGVRRVERIRSIADRSGCLLDLEKRKKNEHRCLIL